MLNLALQKISGGLSPFYLAISATALSTAMAFTALLPAAWAQTAPTSGFPVLQLAARLMWWRVPFLMRCRATWACQWWWKTAPVQGAWSQRDIFWLPQQTGIQYLCTPRRTL